MMDTWDPNIELLNALEGRNHPGRMTGFYVCIDDGEFIKTKPRVTAKCPFCGRECQRLQYLDHSIRYSVLKRWEALGIYSNMRADVREIAV